MAMGRWDRTHEALRQAALELFLEQGYDATGTAQVAAHAGVSEMTLFRHFPTKEALLVDDPFDPMIAAAVRSRPAAEPPMRAVSAGIREVLGQVDARDLQVQRDRLRIIAQTPSLRGVIERNNEATVQALAAALSDRGVDETSAQIAAAAAIAGLSVALLAWAQAEELPLSDALNQALDVLGGA